MNRSAVLKRALVDNVACVARAILGEPNQNMSSKAELRFGQKGSRAVVISGPKKGSYYNHEAGSGGDLFVLIQRECNVGFKEALTIAEQFVGGSALTQFTSVRAERLSAGAKDNAQKDTRDALRFWAETTNLRGTLGDHYLKSRGITTLPEGIAEVLRFHPAGRFGPARSPMIVALCRDIRTNEPRAVHRTALSPRGEKIGRKYLGPKAGTAIKLSLDEEVTQGVVVGEGVETSLSAMMLGLAPAWAVGDANGIGNFPVLAGIDGLTVLVDHDASGAGQRQAAKCRDRYLAAGREVLTVQPNQVGHDINDLLGGRK